MGSLSGMWQWLFSLPPMQSSFLSACAKVGLQIAAPTKESDEEWMCGLCGACFASSAALGSHRARLHEYRCPLRQKVKGTECGTCGKEFWTRLRLRTHIKYGNRVCREAVSWFPDLDPECIEREDRIELEQARVAKAKGNHPLEGPPARVIQDPRRA